MKIVYIHEAIAKVGGIERIYADKMNYLSQKGYDIYLLTTIQAQHPYSFPLSPSIKHIDLDTRHHLQYQYHYPKRLWIRFKINYLFKKRLKEQIKKIDPDIICCTTSYGAETVCKLNCRAKIIIESHSAKSFSGINDGAQRGYISKKYNAFIVAKKMHIVEKECDALVTLTQGDANEWKCKNKTRVIPNIFNEIPEVKSNQTLRRVIGVGRLEYQKRFDNLISVWKIVNKKYPDWILDIFGEGSMHDTLIKQIKSCGLEQVIKIYPPTSNINDEYANSSIFVLSSRYEGFGLVLIEAMSCGLACVSYDCHYGPSDIISEGKNGLLVRNGDTQELANSICKLIEDENLRKEYGKAAREDVKQFLPENIMPQWEQLFNQLCNDK